MHSWQAHSKWGQKEHDGAGAEHTEVSRLRGVATKMAAAEERRAAGTLKSAHGPNT